MKNRIECTSKQILLQITFISNPSDSEVSINGITHSNINDLLSEVIIIYYGISETIFGNTFIAMTSLGICSLEFVNENLNELIERLQRKWKEAVFIRNDALAAENLTNIFNPINESEIKLLLKGTKFQIQVWSALLHIPRGSKTSYSEIARIIRKENAVRAVASAIANNPIGFIIPCHRIIRKDGSLGEYHWGINRKSSILSWEREVFRKNNNTPI